MNKSRRIQHVVCVLMRVSLIQLFLITVFASLVSAAEIKGQEVLERKVSLDVSGKSVNSVLKAIESQAMVTFSYRTRAIQGSEKVTLQVTEAPLRTVLKQLFGDEVSFLVRNDEILLKPRETQAPSLSIDSQEVNVEVTGVVYDEKGLTLPGVNVVEKGTTNGTTTDVNGRFTLNVDNERSVLVFSFIGYVMREVTVGSQTNFSLTLQPDVKALEEVVVVGYGEQKKVNLTGAISVVDAENLSNRPLTNATQALQGVQGVYVNQAGGQPGRDAATIRIRGEGTLNNNNPLVIVDGMEYSLADLNPNDIASISVLKDAASAAIYGSRAANGVILVTTKTGKKGGFSVEYNNYAGFQEVISLPDVVKDPVLFMELRSQAQRNEGRVSVDYSDELIEEYRQGRLTDPFTYPQNDWYDIMFDPAFMHEHNLRFSGGRDEYAYSLSLGYLDQDGVLMGTDSKRYSFGLNTSAKISDRLKVGAIINGNFKNFNESVVSISHLMQQTLKAQGFHPTYLEDGRYGDTFIRTPGHNVYRHPIALATEGENNYLQQRYKANFFAEYKLPLGIAYKLNVGVNKADYLNTTFVPDVYTHQVKTGAKKRIIYQGKQRGTEQRDDNDINTTIFHTLNWNKSIRTHNIGTLLGFSAESYTNRFFTASNEGYLGNELHELNAGSTNPAVSGTSSRSTLMSFFGRFNYDYSEKYLFEANFRYDGSSRFAKGNQWGLFPSFALGWRIDQEDFLKDKNWLDALKMRASWGQLGNERIAMFRYVDLIRLGQDYSFGSTIRPGSAVVAYNDPNISWETTIISNLGLDATLLSGKVNFVFELFNKRTTDILRPVNLPQQVGSLSGPIRNIGTVDNKGYELGIAYRETIKDFSFEFSGSLTSIKNEVVDLNGQTIYDGNYIIQEGHPIDSYYLLDAVGFFQSQQEIDSSPFQNSSTRPGYIKYRDVDNDGYITNDDRVITGSAIPQYTYSFGINLAYKGFGLTSFFQGVQNIDTYAERIAAMPFWFGTAVTKDWITESWTPENPDSKLPIMTTFEGAENTNFRPSNFWLQDASYLRLKNVQLSYSLPQGLLSKLNISAAKIFVNGQNLLTFTEMDDFDPERNIKSRFYYEYPSTKIYSMGMQVKF